MREEKRYNKIRLGDLKKYHQNFELERKADQKYNDAVLVSMPIIAGHHKFDPWLMRLQDKFKFKDI